MNLVASDVMVVGKDEFEKKDGGKRYSLMLTNGTGNPLKLACSRHIYEVAKPLSVKYDVEANLDTVGYNIYGDILTMAEA